VHAENLQAATKFCVGDLDVDVGLQRVARDGVEVPLPKLSFDLFLTLIRAAPNYVSNRQLLARVWPGLVVTDKTVSQRIKLLRDALGDDPEAPRYVGGLRGRGYRLVAEVTAGLASELPEPAAAPLAETSALVARNRPALIATLAAALVAVGGWWWTGAGDRSPTQTPATANGTSATLAVLPFGEQSNGGTDAFIGAGIAEAVLDRLSDVPGLDTIAMDSSLRLGGSALSSAEAAERLGADYLLEGAVERAGDTLSVSARLMDAGSGNELWAERFDRSIADIMDVQEDIARQAATALYNSGAASEALRPRAQQLTEDVDAYLAYLRGRALLAQWTVVAARRAETEFSAAIERDPSFAAAYASLYEARLMAADRAGGGASPNAADGFLGEPPLASVRDENRHLVDRAIALDPQSGAAYFARAIWADDDSPEREQDFQRGMQLDPSNGRGIAAYSEFLDRADRTREAGLVLERALAVDPVSPRAHFRRVMRMRPVEPAMLEAGMLRVLEIDADYQPALQRYAKYRWMFDGDLAHAIEVLEHALALDPGNPWLTHTAVAMYLDIGDVETARWLVAGVTKPEIAGNLLLALYDRDTATAGAAAFEDAAFANGKQENWGAYEALRDWALATERTQDALDALQARTGLLNEPHEIRINNFRAAPTVAHLLIALGRADEARSLMARTIQWIDEYHLPNLSTIYALRVKASLLLLLGEDALALDTLDASFRSNDYLQWWYTLERDPLWSSLSDSGRLSEIAARVHRHVAEQHASLEELRQRGLVPSHAHATE